MSSDARNTRQTRRSRNPEQLAVREGAVTYAATAHAHRRTTLGEALPIKYGKSKSNAYGEPGSEVPVYGSSGPIGTFDRQLTSGATLIIGRKGSAGAVHYSPGPCWPIDTVFYTEGRPGIHLPFFRYLLESLRLGQFDRSTAIPSLSRDDYDAVRVSVPTEDDQRRIVAELETQLTRLDASVAALKRIQSSLKRYRVSVLRAACDGGLVGANGSSWKRATLGQIAVSIRNGWSSKPDATSGIRIFRISAVRCMQLDPDDVRYLGGGEDQYADAMVSTGDVLFTRYNGTRELVGVCAVVPDGLPPTAYPDKLIRVRVPQDVMLPEMLAILSSAGEARAFLESRIRTTAGQSGISGSDLKAMPIAVPSLQQQQQIVAEVGRGLSVVQEQERSVIANLQRAERLRQSILARAFAA